VESFPTILFYGPDEKVNSTAPFRGARTFENFKKWIEGKCKIRYFEDETKIDGLKNAAEIV